MKKKKNEYKSSFDILKSIKDSLAVEDSTSVVEWVLKNKIRTEDGYLIHYNERKYLVDMMNDLTPKQAILASAQVSKTVSMYIKALYLCFKGYNIMMTEPTADLRDVLTKTKLNRIIDSNDIFKNNVTGGLDLKAAWDRMFILSYTFGQAPVGFTTDINIYDEVSRSNPDTIDLLKGRQLDSKYKYEWFISNPKQPYDLLHNTFLKSDQKHWFVTCSHCEHEQLLNWDGMYGLPGNLDREKQNFVCQKCHEILEPASIINGRWIKRYKNREISGYWIWQGMRPTHSIEEQQKLVKEMMYEEEKSKATFFNMFLGLPYSGSDVSVDKELIYQNLTVDSKPESLITMGCDIGSATGHHYVIGSQTKILKMGKAKDWDEIRSLMKKWKVQMCVVDNNPERGPAVALQEEYPNIVWRANYIGNKPDDILNYNEDTGLVNISKHLHFDNIINDIGKGTYKWAYHKNDLDLNEFCEHFATLSKVPDFDRAGNPIFKWTAPSENATDHYAHAFLYWTVANERLKLVTPQYGIFKSDDGENRKNHVSVRDRFEMEEEKETDWLDL